MISRIQVKRDNVISLESNGLKWNGTVSAFQINRSGKKRNIQAYEWKTRHYNDMHSCCHKATTPKTFSVMKLFIVQEYCNANAHSIFSSIRLLLLFVQSFASIIITLWNERNNVKWIACFANLFAWNAKQISEIHISSPHEK